MGKQNFIQVVLVTCDLNPMLTFSIHSKVLLYSNLYSQQKSQIQHCQFCFTQQNNLKILMSQKEVLIKS